MFEWIQGTFFYLNVSQIHESGEIVFVKPWNGIEWRGCYAMQSWCNDNEQKLQVTPKANSMYCKHSLQIDKT